MKLVWLTAVSPAESMSGDRTGHGVGRDDGGDLRGRIDRERSGDPGKIHARDGVKLGTDGWMTTWPGAPLAGVKLLMERKALLALLLRV